MYSLFALQAAAASVAITPTRTLSYGDLIALASLVLPLFGVVIVGALKLGRVLERQAALESGAGERHRSTMEKLTAIEAAQRDEAVRRERGEQQHARTTEWLADHDRQLELVNGRLHELSESVHTEFGKRALIEQRVVQLEGERRTGHERRQS